jgi:hypothetical protein
MINTVERPANITQIPYAIKKYHQGNVNFLFTEFIDFFALVSFDVMMKSVVDLFEYLERIEQVKYLELMKVSISHDIRINIRR